MLPASGLVSDLVALVATTRIQVQPGETRAETEFADYAVLAVAIFLHSVSLGMVAYAVYHKSWPPFMTKSIGLLATLAVGGALWTAGVVFSYGLFPRQDGILTNCVLFDTTLSWMGLGSMTCAYVLRVYRKWKVFIRYDAKMWPVHTQFAVMFWPFFFPMIYYTIWPERWQWYPEYAYCTSDGELIIGVNVFLLGLVAFTAYLVWQLRGIAQQFNDYKIVRFQLISVLCHMIIVQAFDVNFDRDRALSRRALVVLTATGTVAITYSVLALPIWKKLTEDLDYLESYTYGFESLPTPDLMDASLAHQLYNPTLREKFRQFAVERYAEENVDFYLACFERDEIYDYFERQAKTMEIIDKFVRVGAQHEINIESGMRRHILEGDVGDPQLFDAARQQVLVMMEHDLKPEYRRGEGFKKMRSKAMENERQMRLMEDLQLKPSGEQLALIAERERDRASRSRSNSFDSSRGSRGSRGRISIDSLRGSRSMLAHRKRGSADSDRLQLVSQQAQASPHHHNNSKGDARSSIGSQTSDKHRRSEGSASGGEGGKKKKPFVIGFRRPKRSTDDDTEDGRRISFGDPKRSSTSTAATATAADPAAKKGKLAGLLRRKSSAEKLQQAERHGSVTSEGSQSATVRRSASGALVVEIDEVPPPGTDTSALPAASRTVVRNGPHLTPVSIEESILPTEAHSPDHSPVRPVIGKQYHSKQVLVEESIVPNPAGRDSPPRSGGAGST